MNEYALYMNEWFLEKKELGEIYCLDVIKKLV